MITWDEIVLRLALATIYGGLIGLERERKNWAAGMRTHMMVSVGSCLIMMVSAFGFADVLGTAHIELDPSRIAAQVVSGIGFIGAGAILFQKQGTIRGLTTAAGLWTVAAIGLATGGGMYFAGAATTILALIILWAIQPLEKMFSKRFKPKTLQITTNENIDNSSTIKKIMNFNEINIESFTVNKVDSQFVFTVNYLSTNTINMDEVISEISSDPNVKEVYWVS